MSWGLKFKRLINYEFWPFYIFYLPFIPIWLFYGLRSGNLLYFTRVNPAIRFGGFLDYSKFGILNQISTKYIPKTIYFEKKPKGLNPQRYGLNFPLILKPDMGERGRGVELIESQKALNEVLQDVSTPFMLQAYSDAPIELGVLCHRFPNGQLKITSIVKKSFLTVTGNGVDTLEELVSNHIRAAKQKDHFKAKFSEKWEAILPQGESVVLEEIGNHCRGTKFLDACHLITPELEQVFDQITQPVQGFHYGRFDLKVPSLADLYAGQNICIFELNGVNSEVAHIYDPQHSLWYAYKTVFKELTTVYRLSKALALNGVAIPNKGTAFYRCMLQRLW